MSARAFLASRRKNLSSRASPCRYSTLCFSQCLSLLGRLLLRRLVGLSAAWTALGLPSRSVIIQPPQPPQHECLAIRLAGSRSLMYSIGACCHCRTFSGGNADFLPVPCQRMLPYATDRLEGQCTKYIEGLPCDQPPRD